MLVKQSLSFQAYQHLKDDLMAGRYEPGKKLKLRELADRLGVSVTPVREALARLVADQALRQVDHRSVRVPVMDDDRFHEVHALRLELEGRSAERAAASATKADIDALEATHARVVEGRRRNSHTEILLANQQFHLHLCESARMPVLLRLVEVLWLQCGPLMNGMTRWPVIKPKQHPHLAVVAALRARDGPAAREALQQDIVMATTALYCYLRSHRDRPAWARESFSLTEQARVTTDA
ncbi:MAG TPA: GntR family transcriptional regulator [Acetobacteraceae bacterium]